VLKVFSTLAGRQTICYYESMRQSLGSAIKSQRKKLRLSTVALARQLNMDRTYIHKIENQAFLPSPKIIEKIAKELKLTSLAKLYCAAKNDELNKKLLEQRKNLAKDKTEIIRKVKRG
jgi:ribosome-binding protein aMBF1 (putative translation factor)